MSQTQGYLYLREEEISRKALEKKNSDDQNDVGQLNAFLKHGEQLLDIIENHEGSYIKNSYIRENLESRNKGDTGRMMNFLKEYDAGKTWTDNPNKTIWIKSEFEKEEIKEMYEVLEGYDLDY
mgnify:FL=1